MEKAKKETRMISIDFETREGDVKTLSGYAVKWDKLSVPLWGFREKFNKGAFSKSIRKKEALAFYNHNEDMLLGNTSNGTLELVEDDKGLRFEIKLPDTSLANDVRELVKGKYVKGVSFGFRSLKDEWDETGKEVIRTVKEAELFEISPTPYPAYPQSRVSARNKNNDNIYESYKQIKKDEIERANKIRENLLKNREVIV